MDSERKSLGELREEPGSVMEMLLGYARELGFVETGELTGIRMQLLQAGDLERQRGLAGRYHLVSEGVVDSQASEVRPRYQIALELVLAGVYYRIGEEEEFLQGIKDAYLHAHMQHYGDIQDRLELEFPDIDFWG